MTNFKLENYKEDKKMEVSKLMAYDTEKYFEEALEALPTHTEETQKAVAELIEKTELEKQLMDAVFEDATSGKIKRGDYDIFKSNSLKASITRNAKALGLNPYPYVNAMHGNYTIKIKYGNSYFFSTDEAEVLAEKKAELDLQRKREVMELLRKAQYNYHKENDTTSIKNREIREFQRRTQIVLSVANFNGKDIEGEQLEAVYKAYERMNKQYEAMQDESDALFKKYEGGTKWDF